MENQDGINDQERPSSLCDELWEMRRRREMCDVIIRTKDADVDAHGLVLVAASPVLKSLVLNHGTDDIEDHIVINMGSINEDTCLSVLEYIYTGRNHPQIIENEKLKKGISDLIQKWRLKKGSCFLYECSAKEHADKHVAPGEESTTEVPRSDDGISNGGGKTKETCGHDFENRGLQTGNQGSPDSVKVCDSIGYSSDKESAKIPARKGSKAKNSTKCKRGTKGPRLKPSGEIPILKNEDLNDKALLGIQSGTLKKAKTKKARIQNSNRGRSRIRKTSNRDEERPLSAKVKDESQDNKKKNYKCQECHLKFVDKNSLIAHNYTDHFKDGMIRPKEFICKEKECNYKTFSSVNFNVHKRKLHLNFRPICSICGKTYKHVWSLYAHVQNIHPSEGRKTYSCHICQKEFKTEAGVQNHLSLIHQMGPERVKQICPHCGYTCWTDATLSEHLFMKHGVHPKSGKTYKCKYCDYEVTQPSTLKKHEQRHSAEKSFKCELCDKMYVTQFDLNKHKRTVHKDDSKLHHCPFCDYTSKWNMSAVREHILCKHADTHEKRWGCEDCSYRTNSKGNLIKHLRNVHKRTVKTNWSLSKVSLNEKQDSNSDPSKDFSGPIDRDNALVVPEQPVEVPVSQGLLQPATDTSIQLQDNTVYSQEQNLLGVQGQLNVDSMLRSHCLPSTQSYIPLQSGSNAVLETADQFLSSVSAMSTQGSLPSPLYSSEKPQDCVTQDSTSNISNPLFLLNYNY